jgi:hypothetical protein
MGLAKLELDSEGIFDDDGEVNRIFKSNLNALVLVD